MWLLKLTILPLGGFHPLEMPAKGKRKASTSKHAASPKKSTKQPASQSAGKQQRVSDFFSRERKAGVAAGEEHDDGEVVDLISEGDDADQPQGGASGVQMAARSGEVVLLSDGDVEEVEVISDNDDAPSRSDSAQGQGETQGRTKVGRGGAGDGSGSWATIFPGISNVKEEDSSGGDGGSGRSSGRGRGRGGSGGGACGKSRGVMSSVKKEPGGEAEKFQEGSFGSQGQPEEGGGWFGLGGKKGKEEVGGGALRGDEQAQRLLSEDFDPRVLVQGSLKKKSTPNPKPQNSTRRLRPAG